MNISVIVFIIGSFAALVSAYLLEGGHLTALLAPTAAIIVFGGTFGALGISFPIEDIKRLPKIIGVLMKPEKVDLPELINFFKDLSFKTRKNGLLSIESELSGMNIDPFIKKGLQLVVDGVEPQSIQSILELEMESAQERHKKGYAMFEAAGGFAPTMGIVGTVMGLVHVLGNMEDASALTKSIAAAFLATLYGISTANILWLPIASHLKAIDNKEYEKRTLIIEAIILIQSGTNPNTLGEKLKGFLNKQEAAKFDALSGGTEK